MMGVRVVGGVKHTSKSIIYSRGTRPQHMSVCLGYGREYQSPISRSLCLVNVTYVSAFLAYYFTGITKYLCCKRNKDNKMSQRQPDKRSRIPPMNLGLLWLPHSPGLPSLPGIPKGHEVMWVPLRRVYQ